VLLVGIGVAVSVAGGGDVVAGVAWASVGMVAGPVAPTSVAGGLTATDATGSELWPEVGGELATVGTEVIVSTGVGVAAAAIDPATGLSWGETGGGASSTGSVAMTIATWVELSVGVRVGRRVGVKVGKRVPMTIGSERDRAPLSPKKVQASMVKAPAAIRPRTGHRK
jgi:hypothetical protein